MKERLEQRYNLAYRILNEKIGRDCYFPDGPPRCIVCPIRVSSLGTARKALQAMEQDQAIVAPLFASAVMGLSVIDYNIQLAPSYVLDRSLQSWGRCLPQSYYLLGRQKGIDRRTAPRSFAYAAGNISLLSKLSAAIWSG
jgi:hypothetical protein